MNATEPTYFLYSGRLFHEAALPALGALLQPHRSDDSPSTPLPRRGESHPSSPQPRRGEDPSPAGPEDEPVGDEPEEEDDGSSVSKPSPGPGMPIVPEHGSPDANPIDPRVF